MCDTVSDGMGSGTRFWLLRAGVGHFAPHYFIPRWFSSFWLLRARPWQWRGIILTLL